MGLGTTFAWWLHGNLPAGRPLMLTFTWNLNSNVDALKLACEHLAPLGPCVAAFQEVPPFDAADLKNWSDSRLEILGSPAAAKVMLVASQGIVVDPAGVHHNDNQDLDKNRRLQGLTLLSTAGTRFQVLGAHGLDKEHYPDPNEWRDLVRRVLDDFWKGGPLVVLGDLQYNPFEALITGRRGIHALREKDGLDSELQLPQTTRKVRPLYNPMWHLLADGPSGAKGTFHIRGDTDLVWHCIDQIIVSADLKPLLGAPTILTSLKDASATDRVLLTTAGLPDEKRYSDHLPVQMTIDLDRGRP
jgi:hypothetical protein